MRPPPTPQPPIPPPLVACHTRINDTVKKGYNTKQYQVHKTARNEKKQTIAPSRPAARRSSVPPPPRLRCALCCVLRCRLRFCCAMHAGGTYKKRNSGGITPPLEALFASTPNPNRNLSPKPNTNTSTNTNPSLNPQPQPQPDLRLSIRSKSKHAGSGTPCATC